MAFQAKKLRVVLPNDGGKKPRAFAAALDLDLITDELTDCWTARHIHITEGACRGASCIAEGFSDLYLPIVVQADALPAIREALEAQLAEIDRAQEALNQSQAEHE